MMSGCDAADVFRTRRSGRAEVAQCEPRRLRLDNARNRHRRMRGTADAQEGAVKISERDDGIVE